MEILQVEEIADPLAKVQVTNLPAVVTATVPPVLPVASAKVRAGEAAKDTVKVMARSVTAPVFARAIVKVVAVPTATGLVVVE